MLLYLSQGSLITTANLHYLQIEVQQPAVISWSQPSEHLVVEAWLHASHAPSHLIMARHDHSHNWATAQLIQRPSLLHRLL